MKLSNNAIKFLMAQYRAIYKNAYVKGLATAVILTSALAAGQAQAGAGDKTLEQEDFATITADKVVVNGTDAKSDYETKGIYESINIAKTGTLNKDLEISAGATTANKVSGAAATTFTAKSLKIETDAATKGLLVQAADGQAHKAVFDSVTISKKGILQLTGANAAGTSTLEAKTISLTGDAASSAIIQTDKFSVVGYDLTQSGADGVATNKDIGNFTTINLNDKSKLGTAADIGANDPKITVNASVLNVNGGEIYSGLSGSQADAQGAVMTFNIVKGQMDDGKITTKSTKADSKLTINFTDAALTSGGKLVDKVFTINGGTFDLAKDMEVTGTGTLKFGSDLTKVKLGNGGKGITLGTGATLSTTGAENASAIAGTMPITIGAGAFLDLGSGALDLTAQELAVKLGATADKATNTFGFVANAGLKTSGELTINGDYKGEAHQFAGNTVTVKASGTSGKASLSKTTLIANSKLNINADTTAKSITLDTGKMAEVNNSDAYTGLSPTDTEGKVALLLAKSGAITSSANGKLTISDTGTLTVKNGKWTSNGVDIVLGNTSTSGNLVVGPKDGDIETAAELMVESGKFEHVSGNITIGGTDAKTLSAVLDLSKTGTGQVKFGNGEVNVKQGGTLKLSSAAGDALVAGLSLGSNQTKVLLSSGGVLDISGSIELGKDKVTSGASANAGKITFANDSGGTLKADDIKFTSAEAIAADAKIDIGASGAIETQVLTLNNTKSDNTRTDFTLGAGKYIVKNQLSSDFGSDLNLTIADKANLKLGNLVADGTAKKVDPEAVTSGSKTVEYNLLMTSGTLAVESGEWKGMNLTINSGSATVGSGEKDADGNVIEASFTGNKLKIDATVAGSEGLKINKGGVAKFTELDQAKATTGTDSSIIVNGRMTVDGNHTVYIKKDDANGIKGQDEGYGLKIAGNIKVSGGSAVLSLGNEGLQSITGFKSETKNNVTTTTIVYDKDDATDKVEFKPVAEGGKIALSGFGTLELDLSHVNGNKFSTSELGAIRTAFTGESTALKDGFIHIVGGELTDSGLSGSTIKADNLAKFNDFKDIKVDNLMNAQVTDITSSHTISQNVGSLKADKNVAAIAIGQATLNKATAVTSGGEAHFAVDVNGNDVALAVKEGGYLHLNNGGVAGQVNLAGNNNKTQLLVSGGQTQTVIDKVKGTGDNSYMELVSGVTKVNKGISVGSMNTAAGTELTFGDYSSGISLTNANAVSEFEGNVTVNTGLTNIAGTAVFAGQKNFFKNNANLGTEASFLNGETVFDSVLNAKKAEDGVYIQKNAVVTVEKGVVLGANTHFVVGADNEYAADGETVVESGSTGYLNAKYFKLNGGVLMVDPEYGMKTSVAAVGAFAEAGHWLSKDVTEANLGTIDGKVILGKNSALGVEKDINVAGVQNFISTYQDANGSLSEDGVSNVLYLNGKVTVADGGQIVLDGHTPSETLFSKVENNKYGYKKDEATPLVASDLYLGTGSVLALDNRAVNGAVHFDKATATIYAPEGEKNSQMGKIVLAGDQFLNSRNITLFTAGTGKDGAKASNVEVLGASGGKGIRVESINGLMYFTLNVGKLDDNGYTLKLDKERVATAFTAASEPMRDFLIGYTAQDKNWYDVANAVDGAKTEVLLGEVANPMISADKGTIAYSADATEEFKQANPLSNFVAVNTGTAEAPQYVAYEKAYNGFLEDVVRNTNGADADRVGRMAAFGGAAQAALTATGTTSDAVSGRFGMGQSASALTYADNGQGTGMWVTPVYRSSDSDGFAAEGLDFGSDVSLFGVALGGDYSLGNGMRVGAMLNIGSGDADGQGAGQGVSNDFNYFGGAMYAGFSMDALSVVADLSYTTVDSDIETDTVSGKVSTSFDTTALSAGVTGQYTMDFAGVQVAPHAGLRFTRLDMDNFDAVGFDGGSAASVENSTANVFSIPVGVTIAKEYAGEQWTVKPSFDLTLTGNFGDDTLDSTVNWTDVTNWSVATKSEFVDSFTYGAAMGVAAKSGNLGVGVGLNYTGSSNIKEFGASANVRYVF